MTELRLLEAMLKVIQLIQGIKQHKMNQNSSIIKYQSSTLFLVFLF